jgi:membrane protein implicated in regulation of membrane protease activity
VASAFTIPVASAFRRKMPMHEGLMHVVTQILFMILWIAGLMALVIGIYYSFSLLVLATVSRLLPLAGRRTRERRYNEGSAKH